MRWAPGDVRDHKSYISCIRLEIQVLRYPMGDHEEDKFEHEALFVRKLMLETSCLVLNIKTPNLDWVAGYDDSLGSFLWEYNEA